MAASRQRVKAETVSFSVPQSKEEVDKAIFRIGELQRERIRINTEKNDQLAVINQKHNTAMLPLADEIVKLQQGIQTWCEANRQTLTSQGKVKFHNFPSGIVNWRMRPPKVALRSLEMVLDALTQRGLKRFIRTKEEINKDAILDDPEGVKGIPGISIVQGEDFIVTPFETKLDEVM